MNSIENPIITVIMSVFTVKEEYLKKAIESILSQTYEDFEFIIILDGPNPYNREIIKSYKDVRIIIHENTENLGLTKSLNIGLSMAKGKYIARMDADDVSLPTRFEKQLYYMEENSDIAVVGTLAKNYGQNKMISQHLNCSIDTLKIRMLFYNAGIIHPTAFIRKEFLDVFDIKYDESIKKSQDYALWVDVLKYGKIEIVNEVLFEYRRHSEQIIQSCNNEVEQFTNIIRIREWSRLGVEFTKKEKQLLNSISTAKIQYNAYEYDMFFKRLIKWNEDERLFDNNLFIAEITRLWLHMALKRTIRMKKLDMIFKTLTIKVFIPFNIKYCIKYYLFDNINPYITNKKKNNYTFKFK